MSKQDPSSPDFDFDEFLERFTESAKNAPPGGGRPMVPSSSQQQPAVSARRQVLQQMPSAPQHPGSPGMHMPPHMYLPSPMLILKRRLLMPIWYRGVMPVWEKIKPVVWYVIGAILWTAFCIAATQYGLKYYLNFDLFNKVHWLVLRRQFDLGYTIEWNVLGAFAAPVVIWLLGFVKLCHKIADKAEAVTEKTWSNVWKILRFFLRLIFAILVGIFVALRSLIRALLSPGSQQRGSAIIGAGLDSQRKPVDDDDLFEDVFTGQFGGDFSGKGQSQGDLAGAEKAMAMQQAAANKLDRK